MTKKALIGFHDKSLAKSYALLLRRSFDVEIVHDLEEMKKHVMDSDFELYFMDLNLGKRAANTIEPFKEIYELIKYRLMNKEASLCGVSGDPDIVDNALDWIKDLDWWSKEDKFVLHAETKGPETLKWIKEHR